MNPTLEIFQTEARLVELRQRQLEVEREADIERLKVARAELRVKLPEFEKLKAGIEKAEADRIEQRRIVRDHEEQVGKHLNARPQVFLFLPEEPECVQWQREHSKLEAALTREREKLFKIPQSDFQRMVVLGREVSTLEFTVRNLTDRLSPEPSAKHFQIATGVLGA